MPRVPYEVHRARRRAPSVTPTETEYDYDGTASLASYSTYSHVSSSSYRPSPSIHDDLRRRTISIPTHSASPTSNGTFLPTPSSARHSPNISWNERNLAPVATKRPSRVRTEEELQARNERRAARRAEREKLKRDGARVPGLRDRSCKRGSILDRLVKWAVSLDHKGSRARGLAMSLGGVLLYRTVLEVLTHFMGLDRDRSDNMFKALIPILRRIPPVVSVDQPNWAARGMALSLEIAILWTGVITWVKMEGKRKGRSWRTQLTGILTILLSPLILSPLNTDPLSHVSLGLYLWTAILLQSSMDSLACLTICLGGMSEHGMTGLSVSLFWYMLGKCLWLGGPRGTFLLVRVVALIASTAVILQVVGGDGSSTTTTTVEGARRLARNCMEVSWYEHLGDITKPRLLGIVLTQLPTASIVLYSAFSIRISRSSPPVRAENIFPLTSLLPLILLSSALPLYLLQGDANLAGMGSPLMPVTLLLALKGEEGDSSWHWGVVLSNLATGRSLLLPTSRRAAAVQVGAIFAWDYIIGYRPSSASTLYLSIAGYITYILPLFSLAPRASSIRSSLPAVIHSIPHFSTAVSSAILWIAWIWALKRLAEEIWAIGGFAGREDISGVEVRVTDVK